MDYRFDPALRRAFCADFLGVLILVLPFFMRPADLEVGRLTCASRPAFTLASRVGSKLNCSFYAEPEKLLLAALATALVGFLSATLHGLSAPFRQQTKKAAPPVSRKRRCLMPVALIPQCRQA